MSFTPTRLWAVRSGFTVILDAEGSETYHSYASQGYAENGNYSEDYTAYSSKNAYDQNSGGYVADPLDHAHQLANQLNRLAAGAALVSEEVASSATATASGAATAA